MPVTPLTPVDATIIGALAHGAAPQLAALNLDPVWLETPQGQHIASAAIALHQQGKTVNLMNIMASVGQRVERGIWAPVATIWKNGYGTVDPKLAVDAARQSYKVRASARIIADWQTLQAERPAEVDEWLPDIQQRLDTLNNSMRVYDARPSAIYQQESPELMFGSLFPKFGEVLSGGYWSGALLIWCGVSGHGKSTSLYTAAADLLQQGKAFDFFVNERSPRVVVNRVLLACSLLSRDEIQARQGSTPERHEILVTWLKWIDQYMRVYDITHYNSVKMRRIIRNDKPVAAIWDYMRDVPDMLPNYSKRADPTGDMGYEMVGICNEEHIMGLSACQMADKEAIDFKKNDEAVPEKSYGSARTYHASNVWLGLKRAESPDNTAYMRKAKDNLADQIDAEYRLEFNPETMIYYVPKLSPQAHH